MQFVWTPSHMKVRGNDEANALAKAGRQQHPNNKKRRSAEPPPLVWLWEEVGICPMCLDVSSSGGGGFEIVRGAEVECGGITDTSETSSTATGSPGSEWATDASTRGLEFSTDASDGQRERKWRLKEGNNQDS